MKLRKSFFRQNPDASQLASAQDTEDHYMVALLQGAVQRGLPLAGPLTDDPVSPVQAKLPYGKLADPEWGARNAWVNHDIG